MKSLILLSFLVVSCAHEPEQFSRPHWVEAVRSGEEALKVTNGNKTFYRRIAGSKDVSKQTSCNLVVMKAEEDIRKEFPDTKVPFTVEVLFYDEEHQDCAVTLSTTKTPDSVDRTVAATDKETAMIDEASDMVLIRSELAAKFALTGLTKNEFEKYSHDKVTVLNETNLCSGVFQTDSYSIHGLTHICWKGDIIAGYCSQRDRQCWTRTP